MPHGSPRESVVLLASFAAAMAVSWHAHVPVALPMNALLIYAAEKQVLPRAFLEVWCVVPGLLFLLVAFASGPAEAHRVAGLTLLALNGYLVMWAARYIWRGRSRLPLGALR
ncbi:MAG: hypothetical protein GTO49_34165 [Anaerolineae bacterium]|nr:hypothetical protein [Anaerolineae bacterium]